MCLPSDNCAAWASTLISHKHSPKDEHQAQPRQKRKPTKKSDLDCVPFSGCESIQFRRRKWSGPKTKIVHPPSLIPVNNSLGISKSAEVTPSQCWEHWSYKAKGHARWVTLPKSLPSIYCNLTARTAICTGSFARCRTVFHFHKTFFDFIATSTWHLSFFCWY